MFLHNPIPQNYSMSRQTSTFQFSIDLVRSSVFFYTPPLRHYHCSNYTRIFIHREGKRSRMGKKIIFQMEHALSLLDTHFQNLLELPRSWIKNQSSKFREAISYGKFCSLSFNSITGPQVSRQNYWNVWSFETLHMNVQPLQVHRLLIIVLSVQIWFHLFFWIN